MSDSRLRTLERRWRRTWLAADEAAYLGERLRVGDLPRMRLELAAHLGHAPAQETLGAVDAARLPGVLFQAGVDLELVTPTLEEREGRRPRGVTLDERLTVLLSGLRSLEGRDASPARETFDELICLGVRNLVCDLSELHTLSSGGMRTLLTVDELLRRAGGSLTLLHLPERVQTLLRVLDLQGLFCVREDLETALAELPAPKAMRAGSEPAAWLRRLARWGLEVCVRAAVAAAGEADDTRRDRELRAAVAAWLVEPTPARAERAAELVPPGPDPGWLGVAAVTAGRRVWPLELLREPPSREAIRAALVPWALGYETAHIAGEGD